MNRARLLTALLVSFVMAFIWLTLPANAQTGDDGGGAPAEPPTEVTEETTEEWGGCGVTGESVSASALCVGTASTFTSTSYAKHAARSGYVYVGRQVQWRSNPYDSYDSVRVYYQRAWISSSDSSGNLNSPPLYDVQFGILKPYVNHYYAVISDLSGSNVVKYWDRGWAADLRSQIRYRVNLRYYTDSTDTWYRQMDG